MINVTQTFLPPQNEYRDILERAWKKGWLTNRGELVKELEQQLMQRLEVSNCIAMTNGTLPLQIAIKALGIKGDIITTPFSYVATTSAIIWEGCTPVFVDIHPEYLTIDETKIEEAITDKTTAILATHVYGNPCQVEEIERIAKKYKLRVIYDGAHAFGVQYKGSSLFSFGDISTCSFHATKLFHTGEGGALFCKPKDFNDLYFHHNFGHDGPDVFRGLGINAKMSELQAAMGLAVLPYLDEIIRDRKNIVERYTQAFNNLEIQLLKIRDKTVWNYSYFPVIFKTEEQNLRVIKALNQESIFPRRYFYPSLDNLPYCIANQKCQNAHAIAERVLCLPLYKGLEQKAQNKIIEIVKNNL